MLQTAPHTFLFTVNIQIRVEMIPGYVLRHYPGEADMDKCFLEHANLDDHYSTLHFDSNNPIVCDKSCYISGNPKL